MCCQRWCDNFSDWGVAMGTWLIASLLPYLWQLHSAHESYFVLLLFANLQCCASNFNNISCQIAGSARWNPGAKKASVSIFYFFYFWKGVYEDVLCSLLHEFWVWTEWDRAGWINQAILLGPSCAEISWERNLQKEMIQFLYHNALWYGFVLLDNHVRTQLS